jgi:hypothetical protein
LPRNCSTSACISFEITRHTLKSEHLDQESVYQNLNGHYLQMENSDLKILVNEHEILALVEGFKARTLPAVLWTHQAHLITALSFHYHYSEMETICYLRSGIIAYNVSTGGENTPEKGYHETLTIFWCKILRHFFTLNRNLSLVDLCNRFLGSDWSSKDLPMKFYTRDVLFSTQARAVWVKPNLEGNLSEIF